MKEFYKELSLIEKKEIGIQQSLEINIVSEDEIDKIVDNWFK